MKRYILLIVIVFTSWAPCQNIWTKLNGPPGGFISALFVKGDTMLAGTGITKGMIYYSTNRGNQWYEGDLRTEERVADFTYTDDGGFIAAGRKDGLFKSFDLKTWLKLSPEGQDFWTMGRDKTGNVYAGAETGRIYYSSDNGLSWEYTRPSIGRIRSFAESENYIFAGTYRNILKKTPDTVLWSATELNANQSFSMFTDPSNNNIYAGAGGQGIFRSTDEGITWTQQNIGTFFNGEWMHYGIFNSRVIGSFTETAFGFGVGWGAAVSDDQGVTWQWSQSGLPPKVTGFKLAKSGTDTYLSTGAAGVFRSTDFGSSWSPLNNGINSAVTRKIIIDSEGILYTASWVNGIFKSTDDGNTWKGINNGLNSAHMYSIIIDDNGMLMAGSNKEIYRSTNKGEHWQLTTSAGNNFASQMYKDRQNRIYAFTSGTGIYRTSNLGQSWTKIDKGFINQYVRGFAQDSSNNIYVGGYGGAIYKTTNDGVSWSEVYRSTNSAAEVTRIAIAQDGAIYAAITDEGILKSRSNGTDWELMNSGIASRKVITVRINSKGEIFTSTRDEGIYISKDNAETWIDITANMKTVEVRDIIVDSEDNLYLATEESVWKGNADAVPVELISFTAEVNETFVELHWITASEVNNKGFEVDRREENGQWISLAFIPGSGTTTDQTGYTYKDNKLFKEKYYYRLKQIDYDGSLEFSEILEVTFGGIPEYELNQNYPNPFNTSTTIKYSLAQTGRVILGVYDLLGREITSLIDEEKPAGEYETTWNAAGYPSGIYFLRMKAGQFNETRKVILMK